MKFMLLMNAPGGKTGEWGVMSWTPEDLNRHIHHMKDLNRKLIENGEFVRAEGLTAPNEAKIVRAGKAGAPVVTDGPFPETKEFLAGWWIVDVDRVERAYQIAAEASAAPGKGGEPLNMPIEVRQVGAAPQVD